MDESTPDQINTPARGADGSYRRALPGVELDSEACRLAARGWSYSRIGEHQGRDKAAVWRGVQKSLVETARTSGVDLLREQLLAEMLELKSHLWEKGIVHPAPVTDKAGRVVHDDAGDEVVDVQALSSAALALVRISDRVGRLRGVDAPRRTSTSTTNLSITADMSYGEIETQMGLLSAALDMKSKRREGDEQRAQAIAAQIEPPDE